MDEVVVISVIGGKSVEVSGCRHSSPQGTPAGPTSRRAGHNLASVVVISVIGGVIGVEASGCRHSFPHGTPAGPTSRRAGHNLASPIGRRARGRGSIQPVSELGVPDSEGVEA